MNNGVMWNISCRKKIDEYKLRRLQTPTSSQTASKIPRPVPRRSSVPTFVKENCIFYDGENPDRQASKN